MSEEMTQSDRRRSPAAESTESIVATSGGRFVWVAKFGAATAGRWPDIGRERSLKGGTFPDDHLTGAAELTVGGIGDAIAGDGKGQNCCNGPIPASLWPERGRGWLGMNHRSMAELVGGSRRRSTAVDGGRRRTKRSRGDQIDDFGR